MVVFALLNPHDVTTYHTEPHVKDSASRVSSITSTDEYRKLISDVRQRGIVNPVIAMTTPQRRCMVEVGEQRVMIARELGIKTLAAIVYTKMLSRPRIEYERELHTLSEVDALFHDADAPGLTMLKRYLASGICSFGLDVCRHFGDLLREETCKSCGKQPYPVHACSVHGECSPRKAKAGLASCLSCEDFTCDS